MPAHGCGFQPVPVRAGEHPHEPVSRAQSCRKALSIFWPTHGWVSASVRHLRRGRYGATEINIADVLYNFAIPGKVIQAMGGATFHDGPGERKGQAS